MGKWTFDELAYRDPSSKYFEKQRKLEQELIFVCYQGEIQGFIEEDQKYDLKLVDKEELLSKIDILYFYKPDVEKIVRNHLHIDNDVVEEKLGPEKRFKERLNIPVEILRKCYREKRIVTLTMRNGHNFQGIIHTYGIFSIRMEFDKETRLITMKHALYDLDYR